MLEAAQNLEYSGSDGIVRGGSPRTTRTQQRISGSFDLQTGTAIINGREVSLDEYTRFQNMTQEEKFNNYGRDLE